MAGRAGDARVFLLLQGLMGPFFSRLGSALVSEGHAVHGVMFNGGDRFFWRHRNAINYAGRPGDWPGFLERLIIERNATDIVLFGDGRPIHRAAVAVCGRLQVRVHVFEEGYVRPDYVTLEHDGVNGHSTLPRDPQWYRDTAANLPPVAPLPPVPFSFNMRVRQGIAYNLAQLALSWRYPHYQSHRPWHPLHEGVGWLKRLRQRKGARVRSAALVREVWESGDPYFMFPLQLENDSQLQLHSPFRTLAPAIEHVIASFAANAPPGARLIVKQHPLDNGLRDWQALVAEFARGHGVGERVCYMEIGDIVPVVQKSRGLVTINSTTGTFALGVGVPTAVLGQAVYDIPGMTFQEPLDRFWTAPEPPDAELFAAFRRVLIERCLIPGGFFSEKGLTMLVTSAVSRLTATGARHAVRAADSRLASERARYAAHGIAN